MLAGLLIRRAARPGIAWPAASALTLAGGITLAAVSQRQLGRIQQEWDAQAWALRAVANDRMAVGIERAAQDLQRAADRALETSGDREAAFDEIARAAGPGQELVVYRRDSAFAWFGRPRLKVSDLRGSLGVTGASFYLSLFATRSDSTARSVATRLLFASPPADRATRSLAADVARETGVLSWRFVPAPDSADLPNGRVVRVDGSVLLALDAVLPSAGEMQLRTLERVRVNVGLLLALSLGCFIVAVWRARRELVWRSAAVIVGVAMVALAPLSAYSNRALLFDPAIYYTPLGGPLTGTAAALAFTSALILLVLLSQARRQARVLDRRLAVVVVVVVAGLGPFLLRDLARGIQIPTTGVTASLWLVWEVPLFLAAAAVMLTGAAAGSAALGRSRGLPAAAAPALAVLAAVLAPVEWDAPGQWPGWYTVIWILAIASLAVSRRTGAMIVSAATVAALGATTLVWGGTMRARARLAEQDVARLGLGDPDVPALIQRLSARLSGRPWIDRPALLEQYATSELAAAGFPSWLATWRTASAPVAVLATAPLGVRIDSVRALVARARVSGEVSTLELPGEPAVQYVAAVPVEGGAVSIVASPRSRLLMADPLTRLLGIHAPGDVEPPYSVQLLPAPPGAAPQVPSRSAWRREGNELHGDWAASVGRGVARAHVEVAVRPLESLIQRGALIAILNLALVALLWLGSMLADGAAARWLATQRRSWSRSYRTRLSVALLAFFIVPAVAFAVWSYRQLATDAMRARELLVREALRSVALDGPVERWLPLESRRLAIPLFLYVGGELVAASDTLVDALAPTGRLLDPAVARSLLIHGEATAHRVEPVGGSGTMLFGYRAVVIGPGHPAVIAAPARSDDLALDLQARDLGVLVLFATAVGAMAALWLSGIAARQLARPIGSLRRAALALAAGQREPALEGQPTTEFVPVFAAFRRMVSELEASRVAQARAERVLAWGEMARQVAHEIKNPLTPIRLGVQHLRRARSDNRVDFDHVLDQNVERILREIDRLDEIARSFSRYGQPPEQIAPAEPTDVAAVLRDVVALETMGDDRTAWTLEGATRPIAALARSQELREVLLNVLENARLARASTVYCRLASTSGRVAITVRDDGQGIAPEVLPRVFEPHFSTRTSGSGLGLAVSRRIIEAWGGTIEITSSEGRGTQVTIQLAPA